MGADIIGWRDCSLQRELGPEGFLGKLKMRSYKTLIEDMIPPEKRPTQAVTVVVNGPHGPIQRSLTYPEICADVERFANGSQECASCTLSGGGPVGCYHFVTYPIDEAFERLAFSFFVAQLPVRDSIGDQLYRDIISRLPASGTGWHVRRGPAERGGLALLPRPLEHTWGGLFSRKRIDSAQILQALFITLDQPALVVGYVRLWTELLAHAAQSNVQAKDSPTLATIQRMLPFWAAAAAGAATSGWTVLVDG